MMAKSNRDVGHGLDQPRRKEAKATKSKTGEMKVILDFDLPGHEVSPIEIQLLQTFIGDMVAEILGQQEGRN